MAKNNWALPAATLGVNLVGQGINALTTGKQNKESREFAEWMFWQQRKHNLADWHMQNEYNSPLAQMQRLKEANLNPHLIYGNGSADAVARTQPRSADAPRPNFEPVQFDPGGLAIQALTARKIQADIARTEADTNRINQDTTQQRMKNDLFQATYDNLKESLLTKYDADTQSEINRLMRETAYREETKGTLENPKHVLRKMVRAGFKRVTQEVQNMIRMGNLRAAEEKIKQYSLDLIDAGLPPDSPWYWKAVKEAIDGDSEVFKFINKPFNAANEWLGIDNRQRK